MTKWIFILFTALLVEASVLGQKLVGHKKTDVITWMKEVKPDFVLDNTVVNSKFKYLKFIDKINQETLLCFLSDDNICTMTRLMSDYSNLDKTIKRLNIEYKKTGSGKWKYTDENVEYTIELKKDKWYFMLETHKAK